MSRIPRSIYFQPVAESADISQNAQFDLVMFNELYTAINYSSDSIRCVGNKPHSLLVFGGISQLSNELYFSRAQRNNEWL